MAQEIGARGLVQQQYRTLTYMLVFMIVVCVVAVEPSYGQDELVPATATTERNEGLVPVGNPDVSVRGSSLNDATLDARDVIFMIRTNGFRDLNTLRGDLTVAGEKSGCTWAPQGLNLEAIDRDTWNKLRILFGGMVSETADVLQRTQGDGIELMPTDQSNYYQIRVRPDLGMKEAELTYRKQGTPVSASPSKQVFVPGKMTDDPIERPLRHESIGGHFSLTLPADWQPESIEIRSGEPTGSVVSYEWPKSSLVLGRMEQFEGSLDKMFEALESRDIIGVPVKGLKQSQNLTVIVADFVRDFARVDIVWESKNRLRIRVPYDRDVRCDRVWFLFPLDNASKQAASETFRDRLPTGDYDLAKALRGDGNPYPIITETASPVIDVNGDSQWLHLPLIRDIQGNGKYFERIFEIPNRETMEDRYPNAVHALYLYEKDTESKEYPNSIVPVEGRNGQQHLQEQTMQGWKNRGI